MMVDSSCVLTGHAGPVLVRPEVRVLTAGDGDLVPELGAHASEGLGLGHRQGNLYPFLLPQLSKFHFLLGQSLKITTILLRTIHC